MNKLKFYICDGWVAFGPDGKYRTHPVFLFEELDSLSFTDVSIHIDSTDKIIKAYRTIIKRLKVNKEFTIDNNE